MTDMHGYSTPEKIAPHSIEAEEATLGSILINQQTALEVSAFLQASDFFFIRNSWVWEAIIAVHSRGDAVDNLTVCDELRRMGKLDEIGGSAFITLLINNTPTHIHATTYARMVERAAGRRRLLSAAGDIAQIALEENVTLEECYAKAETSVFSVTSGRDDKSLIPLVQTSSDFYDLTEKIQKGEIEPGLPTGFPELDELFGGLTKQDVFIVAARPGVGKTACLLSITLNAAKIAAARIAVFSLEMSTELLMRRLAAMETGIDSQRMKRRNGMSAQDWELFTEATRRLGDLPIFIDDTPSISPNQLAAKGRRLVREYGLDLIVVDYMQLMSTGSRGHDSQNREQEISLISRRLKEIARELNVPVLVAAQLNRDVEKRADKKPQLSDLRESGSIEQDASGVMFIYRGGLYEDAMYGPTDADILVRKNRNGPEGVAHVTFNDPIQLFTPRGPMLNVNLAEY